MSALFVISSARTGNLEKPHICTIESITENTIAKFMQAVLKNGMSETNVLKRAKSENATNAPKISFEKKTAHMKSGEISLL